MSSVAHPAPEQGQFLNVRSRQWAISDVRPGKLPAPALKPFFAGLQHPLTLSSTEDDGLSEELQAVCEIEPGANLIEKLALPEPAGFDPPDKLDTLLHAVRWRAASTADVKNVPATFRSGKGRASDSITPRSRGSRPARPGAGKKVVDESR
jgi:hypothetical protein